MKDSKHNFSHFLYTYFYGNFSSHLFIHINLNLSKKLGFYLQKKPSYFVLYLYDLCFTFINDQIRKVDE